jgi:hypothetical protein
VDEVKGSFGQKLNFVFVEMHTGEGKVEARKEGGMGTPTFLVLDSEGERVYMLQGMYPRAVLERHLGELLARE